jgi:hypothetical protein
MEQVLNDNIELKQKLNQLEDRFDARSTFTREVTDWMVAKAKDSKSETSTIRDTDKAKNIPYSMTPFDLAVDFSFTFDKILEQSRVYRMNQGTECDRSFYTSDALSRTWSIFSGISLANISVISVIAMPLTALDLANGRYYEAEAFGLELETIAENTPMSTTHAWPESQDTRVDKFLNSVTINGDDNDDKEGNLKPGDEPADAYPDVDHESEKSSPCRTCGEVNYLVNLSFQMWLLTIQI